MERSSSLKQKILCAFEQNKGVYLSGEQLARQFSVSRTAIWKAVKALQADGCELIAVPNKGYCLERTSEVFSAYSIQKYIVFYSAHSRNSASVPSFQIQIHPTLSSTNDLAKKLAESGAEEGAVIIAEQQNAGRGRLNRSFYSPAGTGIYMSVLLRPRFPAALSLSITTAAATAASLAIEEATGETTGIKWVNDIYCRGRKVSGILTEAAFHMENGTLEYAVLGIGINVKPPQFGFPEELETIAGAVLKPNTSIPDVRSKITAAFLLHFWHYYQQLETKEFLPLYRAKSTLIGKPVMVHGSHTTEKATVLGIDDDFRLLVRMENGEEQALSTGEVSIRTIEKES